MLLYHCTLTLHDHLFYETRTLGRLYETGRLLHNIALCYALGFAQTTYYHAVDVPQYADELSRLNNDAVYVTPAGSENIGYVVHTFKLGDERSAVMMERSNANIPTYGRAKEISVGTRFMFGVLSEAEIAFPRWIRMGLWLSKGRLDVEGPITLRPANQAQERTVDLYPLNPLDLPASAELRLFDLISMRPSNLVENALIYADQWWVGELPRRGQFYLPAGMRHQIR